MGLFKGMADAKASRSSDYIRPGTYLCYLREFFAKTNRKEQGVVGFGFTVVATLDDTEVTRTGKQPHRTGEDVSWVMQLHKDSTKPNLKRALMNITGVPEAQVTDEFCEALASTSQPIKGFFIEVRAREIMTKGTDGSPPHLFTQVTLVRRWGKAEVEALPGVQIVLDGLKIDTSRAEMPEAG